MKTVIAPLGGLLGAILGGVLWAKFLPFIGSTVGILAFGIGALTGIGMVLSGSQGIEQRNRMHWLLLSCGAIIFAVIGLYIGKFLDAQWNAVTQIAELMMEEQNITMAQALPSAKTIFSGYSRWELMQDRMEWYDAVYIGIATITAFYFTFNPRVRNIFYKLQKNT